MFLFHQHTTKDNQNKVYYNIDNIGALLRCDLLFGGRKHSLYRVFNGLVATLMFCFCKIRRSASVIPLM